MTDAPDPLITGDRLLAVAAALAHPHRVRAVAALHGRGRTYISELARVVGVSRPLLHLHLQKLQDAGLVTSRLELSGDGKALNYFELTDFSFVLTPSTVAQAARDISASTSDPAKDDPA